MASIHSPPRINLLRVILDNNLRIRNLTSKLTINTLRTGSEKEEEVVEINRIIKVHVQLLLAYLDGEETTTLKIPKIMEVLSAQLPRLEALGNKHPNGAEISQQISALCELLG